MPDSVPRRFSAQCRLDRVFHLDSYQDAPSISHSILPSLPASLSYNTASPSQVAATVRAKWAENRLLPTSLDASTLDSPLSPHRRQQGSDVLLLSSLLHGPFIEFGLVFFFGFLPLLLLHFRRCFLFLFNQQRFDLLLAQLLLASPHRCDHGGALSFIGSAGKLARMKDGR